MKPIHVFYQFLIAVSCLLVSSCVTTGPTQTENPNVYKAAADRFTPEVEDLHTSVEITLKDLGFLDSRSIRFFLNYQNTNNKILWTINLLYQGPGWMNINGIKFLVGDEVFQYQATGIPKKSVISLGGVSCFEQVIFNINEELYWEIKKRNNIAIRVIGSGSSYDVDLEQKDINTFNEFYSYIKKNVIHAPKFAGKTPDAAPSKEEYILIDDPKKLKVFMDDYVGKKIKIRLYLNSIHSSDMAGFIDETYGTYFIKYGTIGNEEKRKLLKLTRGEPCYLRGTFSDKILGEDIKVPEIPGIPVIKVMHITIDKIDLIPPPNNKKLTLPGLWPSPIPQ